MPGNKILIVDSDISTHAQISENLVKRGYLVTSTNSTNECVNAAFSQKPELIILDIDAPGRDGIQACQDIRRILTVPIFILSNKTKETDVVMGLIVGCDLYFKRPFSITELIAYVDAAIRREQIYKQAKHTDIVFDIKDLTLDITAHELRRDKEIIPLSITEFKLVEALAQNAGRTMSRDQLLDFVWDMKADGVYSRTVDVHIARIRKKLGDDCITQKYIKTIPGLGYKFVR